MAAVTLNAMRRPVTVRSRNVREGRPTPVTTPQTSDGPEAARPVGGVGLAGSVAWATGPPASRLVVTRAASRTGRCNGYSRLGDVDADRPRQAANRCPSADPDGPTTHACLPASEHARAPNCTGSCEPSEGAIRAGMRSRRRPMNAGRFSPVEPFAPMGRPSRAVQQVCNRANWCAAVRRNAGAHTSYISLMLCTSPVSTASRSGLCHVGGREPHPRTAPVKIPLWPPQAGRSWHSPRSRLGRIAGVRRTAATGPSDQARSPARLPEHPHANSSRAHHHLVAKQQPAASGNAATQEHSTASRAHRPNDPAHPCTCRCGVYPDTRPSLGSSDDGLCPTFIGSVVGRCPVGVAGRAVADGCGCGGAALGSALVGLRGGVGRSASMRARRPAGALPPHRSRDLVRAHRAPGRA